MKLDNDDSSGQKPLTTISLPDDCRSWSKSQKVVVGSLLVKNVRTTFFATFDLLEYPLELFESSLISALDALKSMHHQFLSQKFYGFAPSLHMLVRQRPDHHEFDKC